MVVHGAPNEHSVALVSVSACSPTDFGRSPTLPRRASVPITLSDWLARGPCASIRRTLVISSPNLGVFAVSAAGVLCAFSCVVDALPGQCLRRTPGTYPLFAAAFRTKRLLREHCSAPCQRRRRPGQARHRQGRLQITAVLYWNNPFRTVRSSRAEMRLMSCWLSSGECA